MKYKLSEKLEKTLKDILLQNEYYVVEKRFLDTVSPHCPNYGMYIYPYETKFGCEFTLHCELIDFDEVEELKPYVWYDREKFDGNPNKFLLVELSLGICHSIWTSEDGVTRLSDDASKFMYIERVEK